MALVLLMGHGVTILALRTLILNHSGNQVSMNNQDENDMKKLIGTATAVGIGIRSRYSPLYRPNLLLLPWERVNRQIRKPSASPSQERKQCGETVSPMARIHLLALIYQKHQQANAATHSRD
ncbi:hypothetical protein JOM56_000312 [Amanita muscaria]